ncbi:4-hydroxybenzoate octaprenyltransferase [Roseomonas marmotae]|uniref:4-hydroxybenzoate octaprenyltransferase n=1 Tax=Roseomonas marmotae TaxID=2768161 RepID=A0ABS3KC88_9PROT|nr:4-hydroxybenzoate octaprenyltransferase [Roseomonas marmotae]MBO1075086.1 4-hydroxybenzoate octaprenyltransferase [Roseomonas marmotae]QTI79797.1 4-hydroxybenzoate octaprenyltransferase [Roseomonas marmotae]
MGGSTGTGTGAAPHTDIRARGWVAQLPAAWQPYALLMRLDRPIGVWLLLLPGLWAFALAAPGWGTGLWLTLLFALGATIMRGAGCVVNDLWDRELDRKVSRTAARPLASGAVSIRRAVIFLGVLLMLGLAILLMLNPLSIGLGVLSLVPVALYPAAKRVTDFPQAVLGLTFSWAAPLGYAAATGRLDGAGLSLYAAAFLWILAYDTIYAHQDREDDILVGIRSTARYFGERTKPFLAACYAGAVLLLALAGWLGGAGPWFWPALLLPAAMLARQVVMLDIHNPVLCLRLFQSNRDVGLLIVLAFLAGRL